MPFGMPPSVQMKGNPEWGVETGSASASGWVVNASH